jgi:hypothetical protein
MQRDVTTRYSGKLFFKTVSGSGMIVSRSAQLHKESISKVTAAASAQVSKFCFHRDILEIKLSHLVHCRLGELKVVYGDEQKKPFPCQKPNPICSGYNQSLY